MWYSVVHGFGPVEELAELADGSTLCDEKGEGWVFICPELQCGKVRCTYGGGEKSQTRRDAAAAFAFVTRSLPTV